jgi:hypothetical protein
MSNKALDFKHGQLSTQKKVFGPLDLIRALDSVGAVGGLANKRHLKDETAKYRKTFTPFTP